MGFIYRIVNQVNGKKYVGQTTQESPQKRWVQHLKSINNGRGCPILRKAVKKYGSENFKFEVICECENSELNDREKTFIISENSLWPNGYNVSKGGFGGGFIGKTHTEETRAKLSYATKLFAASLSYEKKREIAKKISEKNKIIKQNVSEITRKKISEALTGKSKKKPSNDLKLYYSSTDPDIIKKREETRNKIREAALKRAAEGKVAKFTSEMKQKHSEIMAKVSGVPVSQFSLDGVFIRSFPSLSNAAQEFGVSQNCIGRAMRGLNKTSCGFIWKKTEKESLIDVQPKVNNDLVVESEINLIT
jgi:group I intron endonuclease